MITASLGEAADFINGFAFKPEDWHNEGLPIVRIQNLTDLSKPINYTERTVPNKFVVRRGELLVSWSATLGVFEWTRSDQALVNQHIFRVVPHEGVDKNFLRHMLSGALASMERHLHGATMKHVNRHEFLATEIPLPSLDEQRRIAAILDQADALRAKRRQVLAGLSSLNQALFQAMFGYLNWNVQLSVLAEVQIGPFGSLLHREDYVHGGVCVLNPMHIREGRLFPDPDFSVGEAKAAGLELYRLREGDVVLGRRGEMARAGIAKECHKGMLCGTGSLILRPRGVDSAFLHAVVTSPRMKAYLERESLGATLPNLNAGIVKIAPAPSASPKAQSAFASRLRLVDEATERVSRATAADDALFSSLQSRAFRGEL